MNISNLPDSLKNAMTQDLIVGIIQFGSSLYKKDVDDIDLAVILKRNSYNKFLKYINYDDFIGFDISLIKEEEVDDCKKFRFGSHGPHLGIPIKNGKVVFGYNPFVDFDIKDSVLKESILLRLYDYIYDVRKSVFKKNIPRSVKERWYKFVRLSMYLLDDELKFPDVLELTDDNLLKILDKHNVKIDKSNILNAYEELWEKVPK